MPAGSIPVSVIVMTRNEAVNLPACLAPLRPFARVFVVDSASSDGTPDIAAAWGAVVVPFHWDGGYPRKKQWCLDRLPFTHDWVLFVDADERLTPGLVAEIAALMAAGPRHAGYFIDGRPVFLGRPLRHGAGTRKLALIDRRRAAFPAVDDLDVAAMWEVEGHYQPRVAGTTGRLRGVLWHADDKPLSAWFDRHNRYSDWEAALRSDGRMAALAGASETGVRRVLKRLFDRLPLRPAAVFLHAYVLRLGLLDGVAGLHHALARAFYYWQVDVKMRERRTKGVSPPPPPAAPCPAPRHPAP
ncbi:glycosyltransferase family 2 protein [Azospirillum halopraeferens]|uniref:glycosyltransferase family 2 protein n=1 Tax=Azospirillum halopraeferens TaxID=34010 RepID=UPI001FE0046E|nr:glycosyltransferase family 2 protein [Azospirillum halopraeferens]